LPFSSGHALGLLPAFDAGIHGGSRLLPDLTVPFNQLGKEVDAVGREIRSGSFCLKIQLKISEGERK
jgi:hypothetical protein